MKLRQLIQVQVNLGMIFWWPITDAWHDILHMLVTVANWQIFQLTQAKQRSSQNAEPTSTLGTPPMLEANHLLRDAIACGQCKLTQKLLNLKVTLDFWHTFQDQQGTLQGPCQTQSTWQ